MINHLYDCIYLSAEEFILLASGAGMEELTCILRSPAEEMTDEQLHKTLFSLCRRGIIRVVNTGEEHYFQVEEPVRSMFHAILASKRSVIAYSGETREPSFWGYYGEMSVVIQVSERDENALRLFQMDPEELNTWLIQEEYLPEDGTVQILMSDDAESVPVVLRRPLNQEEKETAVP